MSLQGNVRCTRLPETIHYVDLGTVSEQRPHHVIVRVVGGNVQRGQELLILLVQVGALANQGLHYLLPLRIR